jgi:hypothetical protein
MCQVNVSLTYCTEGLFGSPLHSTAFVHKDYSFVFTNIIYKSYKIISFQEMINLIKDLGY